jgi:hypothetical protein
MSEEAFDYIYDLLFFNDEESEWWDNEGYDILRGYLENLNEKAIKALIDYSKSWSPSMRFIFSEAVIETNIETSIEIYCKMFLGMESDNLAHCMSGKIEYIESSDLEPELYRQFLEKMNKIEKYGLKMNEELKQESKIINLRK